MVGQEWCPAPPPPPLGVTVVPGGGVDMGGGTSPRVQSPYAWWGKLLCHYIGHILGRKGAPQHTAVPCLARGCFVCVCLGISFARSMGLPDALATPVRHIFFTGKGGVGKTSLSCGTAIALAKSGKKVFLVSTDPASNLNEMLEIPKLDVPTDVPKVCRAWQFKASSKAAQGACCSWAIHERQRELPIQVVPSTNILFFGAWTENLLHIETLLRAGATVFIGHTVNNHRC